MIFAELFSFAVVAVCILAFLLFAAFMMGLQIGYERGARDQKDRVEMREALAIPKIEAEQITTREIPNIDTALTDLPLAIEAAENADRLKKRYRRELNNERKKNRNGV